MKRAIITGFEPFGPYKFNPTQDIAKEYDGKKVMNIEIVGLILPCTYYGAFELLSEKIDELSPEVVLSTGLASSVQRLRIEAIGRNIMNGKYPDANGQKPENKPILDDGKSWYAANSNSACLANALYELGMPAEISVDAEGFICNSLIYLASGKIHNKKLPIKNAFVHTPWTDDYLGKIELEKTKVTIKKEELKKGIEILLTTLAKAS